jgi:solute carrier family 50 protein (sugar transporter)
MYNIAFQKTVVKTKSVEYLPFLLSFFFFINGGVWLLYAFLVRDFILGVSLLALCAINIYALHETINIFFLIIFLFDESF